jgi:hypothetical protein
MVLHVPIKSYDLVINNTKSMNMDKTGVASSLSSSWLYYSQTETSYSYPIIKGKTQVDKE